MPTGKHNRDANPDLEISLKIQAKGTELETQLNYNYVFIVLKMYIEKKI